MSGLVALFAEAGAVQAEALERATRTLDHRGPAARETWLDPAGSIGLGETRLATGARDAEAGPVRVIFDGALYDTERLRGELRARGHELRTQGDAELVAHLYDEHGTGCVEHLRGEFAFVLYDGRRGVLVAARDRCGVKPLVYARRGGLLAIASEAKALLAAGLPAAWDVEAFLHTCVLGGPPEDATLFAGVQRLPAGHLLIAGPGHHRIVRYWDFDYPRDGHAAPRAEADDHEALAAALSEAVRLRLHGTAPIACYLGGLDASTVFGLASRHAPAPLHGFTIAIGDRVTEENALAHGLAIRLGATHTAVPLRPWELARDLDDAVYFAERPFANLGCLPLLQLGRAVREAGFQIVLTGEGSDELFAGYAHFRRDLAGPPPAAREGRTAGEPVRAALGGFVPAWIRMLAATGQGLLDVLHPELAARARRGEPYTRFIGGLEVARQLRGRHPVHQSMYLWSKSVLAGSILAASNDAMQMAHGVECRLPFLDHHVVELSTRLPINRLIRGEIEKYLLREVARPVITDAIYHRPKDRGGAPELASFGSDLLDELVQDTLRGSALAGGPLFDRDRVLALLDALPAREAGARAALAPPLFLAASACLLQQRFGVAA